MDLVVLDMNGVLTEKCLAYVLSENYAKEGLPLWEQYRQGELDTADFANKIALTHRGLTRSLMEEEARKIPLFGHSIEVAEKIAERGFGFVIASADYGNLVRRTALALAPHQPLLLFGNEAVYSHGVHTGIMEAPVVDGREKAKRIRDYKTANRINRIISVGDDPTCLEVFRMSDVRIAYRPKNDELRRSATHIIDDGGSLIDVAELLGKI